MAIITLLRLALLRQTAMLRIETGSGWQEEERGATYTTGTGVIASLFFNFSYGESRLLSYSVVPQEILQPRRIEIFGDLQELPEYESLQQAPFPPLHRHLPPLSTRRILRLCPPLPVSLLSRRFSIRHFSLEERD